MGSEGPTILPILPPLEFPFPDTASSKSPSVDNTRHFSATGEGTPLTSGTSVGSPTHGALPPRSPGSARHTNPRPSITRKKFISERPVPAKRGSLLAMKRRQTGHVPNALSTAAWDSDADSLTSSSEDESSHKLNKISSKISQRSGARGQTHNVRETPEERDYSKFSVGNDNYKTRGKVSKRDGRLNISVNETSHKGYLAKVLGATLQHHMTKGTNGQPSHQVLSPLHKEDARPEYSRATTASTLSVAPSFYDTLPLPTLNIVIMVIGSRGDIQPFLKIGKLLKEEHGHRVRIATHPAFKRFVEQDSGLEFFSVGGDPAEIMAFMVKNPGLIPTVASIRAGEINRRREEMFEMFQGFWRACINATDDEKDLENLKMMEDKHPFVADAIIANPPGFAHVHCAERLGIPLHLMFTMPNTPTQKFPHPMTNIKQSNVDASYTNFISYPLVEMMIWQGLGDLVNQFRVKTLGLEPVSTLWAPGQLFRQKVSYTYLWSPGLVPKPADWGPEIDVVGYVFLDLASSFRPPQTLADFLEAGEPPVYIGFGSIVVDNSDKFTALIFEAVKKAGVRALVSKGWGGLGDEGNTPDNIYMLENTPHDWLFPRVSAVVHHGGAGSTAIGLKCGKPTLIVPFFGDQPFWGAMVSKAGAGSEPIPYKYLTADKLAAGIAQCLTPEAKMHAAEIARKIADEGNGAKNAVKSFHRSLPLRGENSMRCSISADRVAVWQLKKTRARLCALSAEILVNEKKIKWQDLRLLRHCAWNDFAGPGEPFTGGGAAIFNTTGGIVKGIGGAPIRWAKSIKKREKRMQRRKKQQESGLSQGAENTKHLQVDRNASSISEQAPTGKLSSGGQLGKEKYLPQGNMTNSSVKQDFKKGQKILSNKKERTRRGPLGEGHDHSQNGNDEDYMSELSAESERSEENIAQDIAADTGNSLVQTGEALAKAPMDLSLAIAQGFHNAPRLYGDTTVRKPTRISGIQSGLRAAGEEFAYGVYDGWTGLVKHPYQGAKTDGVSGFAKGVGKGVGGFVLKDLAAIFGPFGYTLKGIHKEMIKGRQPTNFIRKARIIQGQMDFRGLDENDRQKAIETVNKGWQTITEIRKEFDEMKSHGIQGRVELYKERRYWRKHGAFENVEQASRALEAKRNGENFDDVFQRQMWELKKAKEPRKSTMSKLQRNGKQSKVRQGNRDGTDGTMAGEKTGTEIGDKVGVETQNNGHISRPSMKGVGKNGDGVDSGDGRRLSM